MDNDNSANIDNLKPSTSKGPVPSIDGFVSRPRQAQLHTNMTNKENLINPDNNLPQTSAEQRPYKTLKTKRFNLLSMLFLTSFIVSSLATVFIYYQYNNIKSELAIEKNVSTELYKTQTSGADTIKSLNNQLKVKNEAITDQKNDYNKLIEVAKSLKKKCGNECADTTIPDVL